MSLAHNIRRYRRQQTTRLDQSQPVVSRVYSFSMNRIRERNPGPELGREMRAPIAQDLFVIVFDSGIERRT